MSTETLILWCIVSFLAGAQARKWLEVVIIRNKLKNGIYEEYLRKQKECPHGYEDWNDCPDCCH